MQPMHVPAGATIFRVGDPSIAVYVIEDGEVAITVDGGAEGLEAGRIDNGRKRRQHQITALSYRNPSQSPW